MEVDPTGDLLEVDVYTVVEVLEAAVVRIHSSDPKYQDCCCNPNVGQMSHKDLMVILAPSIGNVVVVAVKTRATEVLKFFFFAL